jgi:2-oxoglutarate dehydrogenase E2 component (dihydrolipoamide succinyltransferase)
VAEVPKASEGGRFYSPLVRTIAKQEGISVVELEAISGSGEGGRVTKTDILSFVDNKKNVGIAIAVSPSPTITNPSVSSVSQVGTSVSGDVEIIEMDRMRQVIAKHMTESLQVAAHVTSFVEADVTNIVNWRNRVKSDFQQKHGENITFTPVFIEAVCRALRDFPLVNSSVKGTQIHIKKDLNIGMAAALPSGNLIVPVIKNADSLNLVGLSKAVNDLANRARTNKLKPDETQGGTFTLTNVGGFGNIMGTPIINQPQVAIMATGAIKKKPAVLETEFGDVIAIRHMMFLSLSYDHRIVDGALGGSFLRRVADYLEKFDTNRGV